MARTIDGDELLGIERLLDTDVVRQSKTASWLLDQVLHDIQAMPTLTPPNEPLTCGLVDRLGMPLRAGDTVAADKFFVYAVRYGSHNVHPDNCAPAYQVGWYLEIMWAYPGFEDSVDIRSHCMISMGQRPDILPIVLIQQMGYTI